MTAEQVTARLEGFGQQFGIWAKSLPIKTVHRVICALLLFWLLTILVQFVILLIPSDTTVAPVVINDTEAPAKFGKQKVDVAALQALNSFGEAGAVPAVVVDKTPVKDDVELTASKTRLNLTLEGIIHTPDSAQSVAIIVHQGKQEQFYVGDKLPVGAKVLLAKVLVDHVILDNSGRYESLWLYDEDKKKVARRATRPRQAVRQSGPKVTDKRNNTKATTLAKDYRERLYKNPTSLSEVLRISPAQKDGQMQGYRVSPGRDRQQFTELGFKTNDIVTSINGIQLNEPSKALEIYKLMRTATEANFTVDRNGESVEVMVSLGQ